MKRMRISVGELLIFTMLLVLPSMSQELGVFDQQADWGPRGSQKADGSASFSDGIYELEGNGDDIWLNDDEGFFLYSEKQGSWVVGGKFTWVNPGSNNWAKVGPMIREQGESSTSAYYYTAMRGAQDLLRPQWRLTDSAGSASHTPRIVDEAGDIVEPENGTIWLRLTRVAEWDLVFTEWSNDGEHWNVGHSLNLPFEEEVAYGLAITNHEDNTFLAKATVSNVILKELQKPVGARSFSNSKVAIGGSITVNIDILNSSDAALTEIIPEGWTASNISHGGSVSGNEIRWEIDASISELTYDVSPTETANTFTFSGDIDGLKIFGDDALTLLKAGVGVFEFSSDIGNVGAAGSVEFNDGTYTVQGSGEDIWGRADEFHFLFNEINGNFRFLGNVVLIPFESSSTWVKTGLMVRDNLSPDASNYFAMMRTDLAARAQGRDAQGESTGRSDNFLDHLGDFEILRVGDILEMYVINGDGERVLVNSHLTNLTDPVLVGLAVTSQDDGNLSIGDFKNVEIIPIPFDVTRNLPETFALGQPLEVELVVEITEGKNANLTVSEHVPEGFTVSNINTTSGNASESNGTITWNLSDASGTQTLTYYATTISSNDGVWSGSVESTEVGVSLPPIEGNTSSLNVSAVVFEFQNGLNGYEGTQDTFFLTGDPGRLVGDSAEWEWDGSDAIGFNVGVIRFDDIVGDQLGQIPPNSDVTSAILTLNITNSGSGGATVHELVKPFDESQDMIEFTLNIEPQEGDDYLAEAITTLPSVGSGNVLEIDLTSSVQKWVNGETNYGWIILPGGTDGVGAASSEATLGRPLLTVTVVSDQLTSVNDFMIY